MKFVFGKQDTTTLDRAQERCCLLTNGPGGYLSVSAAFSVTRCDQGVLAAARTAPNDRWTLVHRLSEALTVGEEQVFLSTQTFADDAPPPAVRSGGPSVRGRRGGPWRSSSPWRAGRPGPQPLSRGRGGAPLQHRGRGPSAAPLRVDILRQDRGRRFRPQGLAGHGAHYRRLPPGDPPRHPHGAGRLISAGEGLDQVTWMDVCAEGHLPPPPRQARGDQRPLVQRPADDGGALGLDSGGRQGVLWTWQSRFGRASAGRSGWRIRDI